MGPRRTAKDILAPCVTALALLIDLSHSPLVSNAGAVGMSSGPGGGGGLNVASVS